jgi:hypothetical protein
MTYLLLCINNWSPLRDSYLQGSFQRLNGGDPEMNNLATMLDEGSCIFSLQCTMSKPGQTNPRRSFQGPDSPLAQTLSMAPCIFQPRVWINNTWPKDLYLTSGHYLGFELPSCPSFISYCCSTLTWYPDPADPFPSLLISFVHLVL